MVQSSKQVIAVFWALLYGAMGVLGSCYTNSQEGCRHNVYDHRFPEDQFDYIPYDSLHRYTYLQIRNNDSDTLVLEPAVFHEIKDSAYNNSYPEVCIIDTYRVERYRVSYRRGEGHRYRLFVSCDHKDLEFQGQDVDIGAYKKYEAQGDTRNPYYKWAEKETINGVEYRDIYERFLGFDYDIPLVIQYSKHVGVIQSAKRNADGSITRYLLLNREPI